MPMTQPGRSRIIYLNRVFTKDFTQNRGHESQGEITVDHGGDADQNLQDGLQDTARPRRGILAEINGDTEAQWDGDKHGNHRRHHGGCYQRPDAELANCRLPGRFGEKLQQADFGTAEKRSDSRPKT